MSRIMYSTYILISSVFDHKFQVIYLNNNIIFCEDIYQSYVILINFYWSIWLWLNSSDGFIFKITNRVWVLLNDTLLEHIIGKWGNSFVWFPLHIYEKVSSLKVTLFNKSWTVETIYKVWYTKTTLCHHAKDRNEEYTVISKSQSIYGSN